MEVDVFAFFENVPLWHNLTINHSSFVNDQQELLPEVKALD